MSTPNEREWRRRWKAREAAELAAAKEKEAIAAARDRRRLHMMVPTAMNFRRRFEQLRREDSELDPRDRGLVSERGLKTAWTQLRTYQVRSYAERSRTFRTSKPKITSAMSKRQRRRSVRTVQRTNRRLERMGCCDVRHGHKRLMRTGERDFLQITMSFGLPAYGSPPTRTSSLCGGGASASCIDDGIGDLARPPPASGLATADAVRNETPAAPAGTQEGGSTGPVEGPGGSTAVDGPDKVREAREERRRRLQRLAAAREANREERRE